ncbi:MAG: hypothetical protein HOC91_13930 [Nitrospinaceae bacterium]|jgi:hypothetical protein|nr:hypothetical protein [Nitrospinaceae bacterium]MBT3432915.1 hypothetical protein [Nitrospinaceae bacterium]MBT3822763.1 hypothetical protein [Nitrospinaceae bacterium]MBT4094461.1 hypothetical protein [Nitrospinaceae bacterium]MBT4431603.1 hypothetical protein [Nitrospinaceae bacterium]
MAKKKNSSKKTQQTKKNNNRNLVILGVVLLALAVGVGSMFWGKGGQSEIPLSMTADGRVVVLEFFDFG